MNRFSQATKKSSSRTSKSEASSNRDKSTKSPRKKAPATKLPRSLLSGWENCLITNGRFPKGTRKTQENSLYLIRKLIQGEIESIIQLGESMDKGEIHRLDAFLKTKKGLVSYLLSAHLDQLLNSFHLLERVGRKLKWKLLISQFKSFKITDWASGTGACAGTWVDILLKNKTAQENIEINLLERNPMLLEGGLEILNTLAPNSKAKGFKSLFRQIDKLQTPEDELNIHSLGFTWPYFKYNKKDLSAFLQQMKDDTQDNKATLISLLDIPSAEAARELMNLRDQLVSIGYRAIYPCPASTSSCPMLLKEKDWCYSEFDYEPTFLQKTLHKELRVQKPMAKSAAYLFASPKLLEVCSPSPGTARVVGRPKKKTDPKIKKSSHQDFEYLMCTESGLQKYPSHLTHSRIARRGWDMHLPDTEQK
ncbi:MAG: hypothetical protein AB8G05_21845 [Oligoflexales bacterium]